MRNATAKYLDDDIAPDASRDDEIAGEVEVHEMMPACSYCRAPLAPEDYAAGFRHCSSYCRHQDDDTHTGEAEARPARLVPQRRVITARDVRRTLAGIPGVEFVGGTGIIRSREEDR